MTSDRGKFHCGYCGRPSSRGRVCGNCSDLPELEPDRLAAELATREEQAASSRPRPKAKRARRR